MSKSIKVKPYLNKRNGQIVISLPKKKLPLKLKSKIMDLQSIKISIENG